MGVTNLFLGNRSPINSFRAAAVGALVCLSGVFSASALQLTTAPAFGPYQIGSGGEFTVAPDAALAGVIGGYAPLARDYVAQGTFQTFCLERNEFIADSTTYDVTLNTQTLFSGRPLTVGAAYLYQQFALGTLTGYNYADAPAGSRAGFTAPHGTAYELQHAIWYYMGEYGFDQYNIYMNGTVPIVNPFGIANGAFNVAVLNLWAVGQPHDTAHTYQDVLVYRPVPEPSAFALVTMAITAFVASRKRK